MLLHGVPDADIQLEDTLLHPQHREAGELERFDRVIANPPFSQKYTTSNMEHKERFRWGWAPTTGKKADLMFAQHMLSVCRPRGMVATVMPNGVLFRGSGEKDIRKKFLDEDLIETIIGLPQNLFYGAGIPACILVMRPNLSGLAENPNKPVDRRGKVLFINADAEFYAGRAQNYLRPEHIQKIASTFERFEDVPGYSRRVPLAEIKGEANDYNLNIRRYVDNSPPPEPHDVPAHLVGGVPVAEVTSERPLIDALDFDPSQIFVVRASDAGYFDFDPSIADRAALRSLVESDAGVRARLDGLRQALSVWWSDHSARLADLPSQRNLNAVRAEFLDTFVAALLPLGVLDHFKLAGVIASWWTETLPDFKTLVENGFAGVIDGWVDAIADAVEDDDATGPSFDPFGHKLVLRTMADYLERIALARAEIARLKGQKEVFEQSNAPEDADEEELENWNYAKDMERKIREIKVESRDRFRELGKLERSAAKARATDVDRKAAIDARARLRPILDELAGFDAELAPYDQIKRELTEARGLYRELTNAFVNELRTRCAALNEEEQRTLVLELFAGDVQMALGAAATKKRQLLSEFIEGLWHKYRVTLTDLSARGHHSDKQLKTLVEALGYR